MGFANAIHPLSNVSQGWYYAVTGIVLVLTIMALAFLDKVDLPFISLPPSEAAPDAFGLLFPSHLSGASLHC